jgi:enoyl-CoA hydratase/carnithine racemase
MAMKKEYTCVLVETDKEGITWITFNRPEKRTAMSPTLHIEMEEILCGLETDEATKVIVLTGAGNSWSAGMDLKQYFLGRVLGDRPVVLGTDRAFDRHSSAGSGGAG